MAVSAAIEHGGKQITELETASNTETPEYASTLIVPWGLAAPMEIASYKSSLSLENSLTTNSNAPIVL